jgi:hypothetical protein
MILVTAYREWGIADTFDLVLRHITIRSLL